MTREEIEDLLPCPFCDGPAEFMYRNNTDNELGIGVRCKACFAQSGLDYQGVKESARDRIDAVERWNRRPKPKPKRQEPAPTAARAGQDNG